MKNSSHAPSATSLPRAPRDDVGARSTRYLVMMGVRILCFILMVVITPYGWFTWLFGAAAIFLPYIAVVLANVGQEARSNRREDPEPALPATPGAASSAVRTDTQVIRVDEQRALQPEASTEGPEMTDDPAKPDTEKPDPAA